MIGTECDYGSGLWDTWDQSISRWIHSSIPCPKFTPNVWHHIQLYVKIDDVAHTYKYVTLVVDDVSTAMNITQQASNVGWGDNAGVQYQIDVNASGSAVHAWIDKSKLTIW